MRMKAFMVYVSLLLAGGTPSFIARGESPPADSRVIAPGDLLEFRVVESGEGASRLPVASSGELEVPYLGRVAVAGKKTGEAAGEIKELLEKKVYFVATVLLSVVAAGNPPETSRAVDPQPSGPRPVESKPLESKPAEARLEREPAQVTVVGRVRLQGIQDLPREGKYYLSQAIAKAGGLMPWANGRKVQVVRRNELGKNERFTADVLSVMREGQIENDVELQPGDMVIVPEKLLNF